MKLLERFKDNSEFATSPDGDKANYRDKVDRGFHTLEERIQPYIFHPGRRLEHVAALAGQPVGPEPVTFTLS